MRRLSPILILLLLQGCASTPKVYEQANPSGGSGTAVGGGSGRGVVIEDGTKLELIEHVAPEYPAATKAAGIQGTVQLKYRVNPDGSVSEVSVLKSAGPALDRHAIAAVSKWKYRPFKGSSVYLQTPVVFEVKK